MFKIENEFLKVSMRPFGAELTSIFDKRSGIEHLWQADAQFWGWHAPVLFPVIGRCWKDEITVNGKNYPLEKHGFARKSNFEVTEQNAERITFVLTDSEHTLKLYPFKFEFYITYVLKQNKLDVLYKIINTDTQEIYFQLGGHPAFAVPFNKGEKYEDYAIEFENKETANRHLINEEGFFNGVQELVLDATNTLPLHANMFNQDALIFKDLKSRRVRIKSKNHNHYLQVTFTDFNFLGLWAKENASYICIEPWLGCADTADKAVDFKQKEGIISLVTGGEFNTGFSVEISG